VLHEDQFVDRKAEFARPIHKAGANVGGEIGLPREDPQIAARRPRDQRPAIILPVEGDHIVTHGWRFTVREMEGRRIKRVEIAREVDAANGELVDADS
jgi:hypothetical protein